jgi:hypothetical protein
MQKIQILTILLALFSFVACESDPEEVIIDSSQPQGTFTPVEMGTFVEQNMTGSAGTAALGTDEEGTEFLRFGSDFMTNLGTGTVTVYLSTSQDFMADPGNGNPDLRLVGPVRSNGENFFKLDPAAESKFTHVILWCGSANIPFGYAALN